MAIRGLTPAVMSSFQGKNTSQNLTDATPGTLLSAKNMLVLSDNQLRRAPGYTLVAKVGTGPILSTGDFQRNVDQKQFVFVQSGTSIFVMQADGSGLREISAGEDPSAVYQYVQNSFICYASNGINAWRFVDNAGTLTKYKWGISAPLTAPAIALSPGTLTLSFGRTYVACYVSKYTDSLGIQRISVGPPSPISAHTGPIANQIVELSDLDASTDPQVNFIWIFETSDSPFNTSATFFFAAEIANGTTSYGDALLDANLDQTRLAPFDNNPAPPSPILETFQSSVAALNVDQLRLSGTDLITLGIPEEAWPLELFFNIPSGSRLGTAMISPDAGNSLIVDTADAKFDYTGYDASTFTEADNIASPGTVGPRAQCKTPFGVAYLSQSQRLWLWRLTSPPSPATEISGDIAQAFPGTYGMEDLSVADLPRAILLWYSFGKIHFIAVIARTNDAPDTGLNLIQLWSIPVKGSQSSGQVTGSSSFYNQIGGIFQTDKIPSVGMTSGSIVRVGNQPFVFLGDASGNVYRFPDGYTDNGIPFLSNVSIPWTLLGTEAKKRFYWLDLWVLSPLSLLLSGGPVENFKVYAATSESAEDPPNWIECQVQLVPSPDGPSEYAIRANLQVQGLNVGRYVRFAVAFPQDNNDEVLLKAIVWHAPMYAGTP
jgi:hypothetical protein